MLVKSLGERRRQFTDDQCSWSQKQHAILVDGGSGGGGMRRHWHVLLVCIQTHRESAAAPDFLQQSRTRFAGFGLCFARPDERAHAPSHSAGLFESFQPAAVCCFHFQRSAPENFLVSVSFHCGQKFAVTESALFSISNLISIFA